MSEWISVKERMPNKRGDYVCWQPDIYQNDEVSLPARAVVITFTGQRWRSSFAVTHWMPLPRAPRSTGETGEPKELD